ncbi:unnamed protein product [Polarella glacialis]|uniref:Uncharacterized protein n=1 Tax=Polarella glacialis TaxID=89957 RepID=A0A813DGS0_POLGL|nr:unnamed protein product [Polarella glacialis]
MSLLLLLWLLWFLSDLSLEAEVFSGSADLSEFKTDELNRMASDIREASRKLAIVLAAGSNTFVAQAQTDGNLLGALRSYIDPAIALDLNLEELVPFLNTQLGQHGIAVCPHGLYPCRYGCKSEVPSVVPPTISLTGDFNQEASAADSMKKLARHFSEMAKCCGQICSDRSTGVKQKQEKQAAKDTLTKEVQKLIPLLRSHVLRIGIAKGQHLNISSGCGNVATITNLFECATVENAHRQLEDCRDRLLQELTLRRLEAKMNALTPKKCAAKRRKLSEGEECE